VPPPRNTVSVQSDLESVDLSSKTFDPEGNLSARGYLAPPALSDGELVVDLIERIANWPQSDPTSASTAKKDVLRSA